MQILSSSNTEHLNATVKFRLFCRKLHNPLTSSNEVCGKVLFQFYHGKWMHMVDLWHTKVRGLFREAVGMKIWEEFLSLSWESQRTYCKGTQNHFPSYLPTNFPDASFWITHGKHASSLLGNSAASWIWSSLLSCVPREERNRRGHHLRNLCQRHHCIWGQKSHKNCQFKIPVAWNRENFSSCELQPSKILCSTTLYPFCLSLW